MYTILLRSVPAGAGATISWGNRRMTLWIRYENQGAEGFGTLDGETITVHSGDMIAGATATGETVNLSDVTVLAPIKPGKMVALWNNYNPETAEEYDDLLADFLHEHPATLRSSFGFMVGGSRSSSPE